MAVILFLYDTQERVLAKVVVLEHVMDPSGISNYEGKSNNMDPFEVIFGILELAVKVKL